MILEGKKIAFLGDSITEGVGVSDCKNNRYDNILKKKCGLAATYNYGISGTRLAHQTIPSEKPRFDLCFCGRAYDVTDAADIVVVYGGINDYIHGDAPFGEIGDRTPASFCGGVWFLMKLLRERFGEKPIVFLTPARCCFGDAVYTAPSRNKNKRADAKPVADYVDVIVQTAKEHGVFVLDLFRRLPIDPTIEADHKKYTSDGLHFNDAGHHVLASLLEEFLRAL